MTGRRSTREGRIPAGQRRRTAVRLVIGGAIGLGIVIALVKVTAEARHHAGIASTLRGADAAVLLLAAAAEATSYLLPAVALRRMGRELRPGSALRIAVAALGMGPRLPASPVTGSGIAYAELRRAGTPASEAATRSTALVIGIPASSMAVLAGPVLIASGLVAPLPPG